MAVACSGGADSTFLLRAACDSLGRANVLAVLVRSALIPANELARAQAVIGAMGCPSLFLDWDPFVCPEVVSNPPDRCYHCKKRIYSLMRAGIDPYEITVLLDGTNLDDLDEYRPGLQAIRELDVAMPLVEAGLTKSAVRRLSRQAGLSTWNRPSASCLATRIPCGTTISAELIKLIAQCEEHLLQFGYAGCRVRMVHGKAHIELAAGDLARFVSSPDRLSTIVFFAAHGIRGVLVDLQERKFR